MEAGARLFAEKLAKAPSLAPFMINAQAHAGNSQCGSLTARQILLAKRFARTLALRLCAKSPSLLVSPLRRFKMTTSAPPLMLSAPAHSITWNGPDSDVDHMPLDLLDAKLLLVPENRENRGGTPFMVILDEYGYYMNPCPLPKTLTSSIVLL